MKVLIVSTSDLNGGAAIAAYRLMQALNINGITSRMLVRDKSSKNNNVLQIGGRAHNKWRFYWERARIFLNNRLSRDNLFDVSIANSGICITHLPQFREADIIHLHWINQGMLSLNEIERIVRSGKKIVWTMHDMWAFTGICHHAGTCRNFEHECGHCPYLAHPSGNDMSNTVFLKKQGNFRGKEIAFVACSNWLKKLAEKSPLTADGIVKTIANPVDTSIYRPQNKFEVRQKLALPPDKKIVLYAAAKASDKRKGVDYLVETSRILKNRGCDLLFLIVGSQGNEIAEKLALPAHIWGFATPEQMPDLYNAADLFVTPSLQENLPNTIMESMACGTPCVGFEIGGIPEMIHHGITGYVGKYKNSEDLVEGILYLLYETDSETISANCREFVLNNYSPDIIAKKYITLYNSI